MSAVRDFLLAVAVLTVIGLIVYVVPRMILGPKPVPPRPVVQATAAVIYPVGAHIMGPPKPSATLCLLYEGRYYEVQQIQLAPDGKTFVAQFVRRTK